MSFVTLLKEPRHKLNTWTQKRAHASLSSFTWLRGSVEQCCALNAWHAKEGSSDKSVFLFMMILGSLSVFLIWPPYFCPSCGLPAMKPLLDTDRAESIIQMKLLIENCVVNKGDLDLQVGPAWVKQGACYQKGRWPYVLFERYSFHSWLHFRNSLFPFLSSVLIMFLFASGWGRARSLYL